MIDGTRCNGCGAAWFPAAARCAACGSFDVVPAPLECAGWLRSVTRVHSSARQPSPWGLGQVETDDGVLVVGFTEGDLKIGDRVALARLEADLPVLVAASP